MNAPKDPRVDYMARETVNMQAPRTSSQTMAAVDARPSLAELGVDRIGQRIDSLESGFREVIRMLSESKDERMARKLKDEFAEERRKLLAEEADRIHRERMRAVTIGTTVLTTIAGVAVQLISAYVAAHK